MTANIETINEAIAHADTCTGLPRFSTDSVDQHTATCDTCDFEITGAETRAEAGIRFFGGITHEEGLTLQRELEDEARRLIAEDRDLRANYIPGQPIDGFVGRHLDRIGDRLATIEHFIQLPQD